MPPTVVCRICQNLDKCDATITWDSLKEGAESGCNACRIIKEGISSLKEGEDGIFKLDLVTDMSLFVYAMDSNEKYRNDVFEFYTLPGRPVIWPMIGPARSVSKDSSSDDCIDLARRWLNGCLSSHPNCRRNGVPPLPTRVIEVGSSDADVRLFVNESGKRAEYAALSHCWGSSHPLTLTKKTLNDMQRNITFDNNSKTFKDAVNVTRRLGIPYLWIDSLCILQDKDDISDWEVEAPKMSSVYNRATITISAASSVDTSGGLFPKEEDRKEKHKSIKLASTSPSGDEEFVHVRVRSQNHFQILDNAHASTAPEEPKLRTRGWVLQEDCLSARMLHFRKEELAWTCSTYSRCECRIRPAMPMPHPFRADIESTEKTKDRTQSLNLQWPAIVMDYTRRHLTKYSDRVAALSGLANYMESQTTDTYYCGIWYEDMAYQLLWYVDRKDCPQGIPHRFEFPYAQSWSWMSISGPVSYYERHPAGVAPSHPAMRSRDAVHAGLKVINVGRLPSNWNNLVGEVFACPAALIAYVMRVEYDSNTKSWQTLDPIKDFDPANLRVNIDTLEDDEMIEVGYPAEYILILAARWIGQGMTFLPMQAVCILARRMLPEDEPVIRGAARFQVLAADQLEGGSKGDMILPDIDNSFERVGLVRGAGSIQAWRDALGVKAIFLF